MALVFMDGFDAGDAALKWNTYTASGVGGADTPHGSGMALVMASSGSQVRKFITPTSKITIGFHNKILGIISAGVPFCNLYGDTGVTLHLGLRWDAGSSTLSLYRAGSVLLATSPAVLNAAVWNHVEMQATINDTTGTCVVKVNGVTVINYVGDTRNAGTSTNIDNVYFNRNQFDTYVDNVYICDHVDATATQGAPNNDFLGDVRCITLAPNGAGTSTQFTPSAGANYTCVDELPYSATDYVTGSTTQRDTYATADLAAGYTILATQQNVIARKSDAGALSVRSSVRSGGSFYAGADEALAAGDLTFRTIRGVDPATSALWTTANLNAAEFGVEVP